MDIYEKTKINVLEVFDRYGIDDMDDFECAMDGVVQVLFGEDQADQEDVKDSLEFLQYVSGLEARFEIY